MPAAALRKGGVYSIVGYGGDVRLEHLDVINRELTVIGNQIGSHADLVDLMDLDARGLLRLESHRFLWTTRPTCWPSSSTAASPAEQC